MDYIQNLAVALIRGMHYVAEDISGKITDDGRGELAAHPRGGELVYSKRFRKSKNNETEYSRELGTETDPRTIEVLESKFYREQKRAMDHSARALEQFLKDYVPFDVKSILYTLPAIYRGPLERRFSQLAFPESTQPAKAGVPNIGKSAKPRFYRLRSGIYVQSHGEYLIGSALEARGIPFRYEPQLRLRKPDGTYEVRKADFEFVSFSREELYWEHFGLLDSPNYRRENSYKLLLYMDNGLLPGINLIMTADPPGGYISMDQIEMVIEHQLLPMLQQ